MAGGSDGVGGDVDADGVGEYGGESDCEEAGAGVGVPEGRGAFCAIPGAASNTVAASSQAAFGLRAVRFGMAPSYRTRNISSLIIHASSPVCQPESVAEYHFCNPAAAAGARQLDKYIDSVSHIMPDIVAAKLRSGLENEKHDLLDRVTVCKTFHSRVPHSQRECSLPAVHADRQVPDKRSLIRANLVDGPVGAIQRAHQTKTIRFAAIELLAPLLFAVKRARPLAFVLGIGLHVVVAATMEQLIYFTLFILISGVRIKLLAEATTDFSLLL